MIVGQTHPPRAIFFPPPFFPLPPSLNGESFELAYVTREEARGGMAEKWPASCGEKSGLSKAGRVNAFNTRTALGISGTWRAFGPNLGCKIVIHGSASPVFRSGNLVCLWRTRPANKRALSAQNDSRIRRVRVMDSSIKKKEISALFLCNASDRRWEYINRSREIDVDRFFFLFLINLILELD